MPFDLVPIEMLDPAGGTPGQAAVVSPDGTRVEYADPATGATLPWFNVRDTTYGAAGDGTTDDTAAINAAIADLNTAGAGVLYFPAGTYKCTAALTTITAHTHVLGDGAGDLQAQNAATMLKITATTGYLMTLAGDGTIVENIGFENPTTTTQTAGAAIRVTQGDLNRYKNITVRGFYDNIVIEDGALWTMEDCYLVGPVRYGLYVRHIDLPDGGDQAISSCHFYAEDRNAVSAIRYESGGGLKITGIKVNTLYGTGFYATGLDMAIGATTGVLTVTGNSFENVTGQCIKGTETGGGSFQLADISGNQFGYYSGGSYSAVDITGWNDVVVVGNTGLGSSSAAMVKLTSVTNGAVGLNSARGFAAEYTLTSCTSITTLSATGVPTTRTFTAGTGLTGGGDLTADRTLAIDTTAEAERIRDIVGAALVQGAGVTITVDDAGDTITITIAASGSNGLVPVTALDDSGNLTFLIHEDGSLIMAED